LTGSRRIPRLEIGDKMKAPRNWTEILLMAILIKMFEDSQPKHKERMDAMESVQELIKMIDDAHI